MSLYFMFSLLAPRYAGNGRAVLRISVTVLAIFRRRRQLFGLGIYSGDVLRHPAFELNCFLTRSVYLVVVVVMLGYLGTYEGGTHRARREAERTATMEDRRRLARDLHDGLLQWLTGTILPPETARCRVETDRLAPR